MTFNVVGCKNQQTFGCFFFSALTFEVTVRSIHRWNGHKSWEIWLWVDVDVAVSSHLFPLELISEHHQQQQKRKFNISWWNPITNLLLLPKLAAQIVFCCQISNPCNTLNQLWDSQISLLHLRYYLSYVSTEQQRTLSLLSIFNAVSSD